MKVAIIPARGGSKRIPKKNIREFYHLPMIAWSIKAAQSSQLFDRIIVSTDCQKIAEISQQSGAEVPFIRPDDLANDFIGTVPVVKHAIEELEVQGASISHACCIYATAPFLKAEYLKSAWEKLEPSDLSFVFAITSFPFPVQRAIKLGINETVDAMWPEHRNTRSQDLVECYHDAGQFYWGTRDAFVNEEIIFSPLSKGEIIPRHLVQDIDTEEDWIRAELMFEILIRNGEIKA